MVVCTEVNNIIVFCISVQFTDAQKALQKANTDTQRAKKEFEEYKIKAAAVLQVSQFKNSPHMHGRDNDEYTCTYTMVLTIEQGKSNYIIAVV